MKSLPERPSLDHLRKQAKELLQDVRRADPVAIDRVRAIAPHLLSEPAFRLHDAQSCIAREYGFASWSQLKIEVESRLATTLTAEQYRALFCVHAIGKGFLRARPTVAALMVERKNDILRADPHVACAMGDVAAIEEAAREPNWINSKGGPFNAPPLVMATHSALIHIPERRSALIAAIRRLIELGAEVNGTYIDPDFPNSPLSALYGSAGRVRDPEAARILLEAGANPNDNESLYHSCEGDDLACTQLLLNFGAKTEKTNALFHTLDRDDLPRLKLLLQAGSNPNDKLGHHTVLAWALYRHRSLAHVEAILAAGANRDGKVGAESYYSYALRMGRPDVAALFEPVELSPVAEFVAACAAGDVETVAQMQQERPNLISELTTADKRLLPDLAQAHDLEGVKRLVSAGWPIDARGGDWDATALNMAVFHGLPEMTAFLLENGAHWSEKHGYGDCVIGTLSFASMSEPNPHGDYPACAKLLVEHGMPVEFDKNYNWPEWLQDYFEEVRANRTSAS